MNNNEANLAAALARLKGITVDEAAIRAHVMRPQHLIGAVSDGGRKDAPLIRDLPPQPGLSFELNIQGFIDALQSALTNLTAGYSLRLRQNGLTTLATVDWNWAKAPQDGSESWTPEVRAHVASLSKIPTAIAMTKLLIDKGMSYDTPIIDWLPDYWNKGPSVNLITFRQLMDHKSGLAFGDTSSRSDYEFMKYQIEAGTTHLGQYCYQNMNYGLCRILISTIDGTISPDWFGAGSEFEADMAWDSVTISAYQAYVQANVFAPSGVAGATLDHESADALAYNFPVSGNGWNSQDLSTMAGPAGWHMTVDQLLAVMSTFRRSGTIMSPAAAQTVLDAGFGLNWTAATALGTYYAKVGGWYDGSGHMEQGIAFFLPQEMELVLLVNSPLAFAVPGALLSYDDTGAAGNVSNPVTVGFDDWTEFKFLFAGQNSAGQDRIYAVNQPGQLLSYADNGTPGNVFGPVIVGFSDWTEFKFLFAGRNSLGQNRIYAVQPNGQLWSYADNGTPGNVSDYVVVGFSDWTEFKFLFAGGTHSGKTVSMLCGQTVNSGPTLTMERLVMSQIMWSSASAVGQISSSSSPAPTWRAKGASTRCCQTANCCPTVILEHRGMSQILRSWASAGGQISSSSSPAETWRGRTASTAYGLYQRYPLENPCMQRCPAPTRTILSSLR